MNFVQFYSGIRTRWVLILAMMCLSVGSTLAFSLFNGKIYSSKALVLVDMHAIDPLTFKTNPLLKTERQQMAFFVNKIYLAISDEVSRRMAASDPLINSPELYEYWQRDAKGQGDMVAWYAKKLSDSIVTKVPTKTTIIEFSSFGQTPERAAAMANAYARAFIDVNRSIQARQAQKRVEALKEHSKKIKAELENTWKEFNLARKDGGLTHLSQTENPQNISTFQLNTKLSVNDAEEVNSRHRLKAFQNSENTPPELSALNFSINGLSSDISRERAQIREYKSILGKEHPSVKQGEARLAELQRMLDEEITRTRQQEQQASDVYAETKTKLNNQLTTEKEKSFLESLERNKIIGLAQKMRSLSINYSMAYQAERDDITNSMIAYSNVVLISPATPATKSSLPNWPLIIPFSAAMGLLIGLGAAYALERLDGRIHTPDTIEYISEIKILGSLPNQKIAI